MTENTSETNGGAAPDAGHPRLRPGIDDSALVEAILRSGPASPFLPTAPPAKLFRLPKVGDAIVSPNNRRTYLVGPVLGDGSFGVVYGATDNWEKELAIKVLKPRGTYEEIQRAAHGETISLFDLRHLHITYVYDMFEYNDAFYIVSERCGPTVAALVDPQFDGLMWVRPVARCLLHALSYIHDRGYVHQDVHINNVFLSWSKSELDATKDRTLSFKLGDLGLAKPAKDLNPQNTLLAEWMLPPEYLDSTQFGPMDHRIDIYHAALLLLQVLSGKRLILTREQVLAGEPRMMAEQFPHPLGRVLSLALRRHVDARPSTALQFWEQIKLVTPRG
jgi:serine/threonine protein kinase